MAQYVQAAINKLAFVIAVLVTAATHGLHVRRHGRPPRATAVTSMEQAAAVGYAARARLPDRQRAGGGHLLA